MGEWFTQNPDSNNVCSGVGCAMVTYGHNRFATKFWAWNHTEYYPDQAAQGGTPIHYLYGYVLRNGVVILKLLI